MGYLDKMTAARKIREEIEDYIQISDLASQILQIINNSELDLSFAAEMAAQLEKVMDYQISQRVKEFIKRFGD